MGVVVVVACDGGAGVGAVGVGDGEAGAGRWMMVRVGAQWFDSGKVHKKTQMPLGFFRGEITCGEVTRFTLRKFGDRDEAELYALHVTLRMRGMFPSAPLVQREVR